KSFVAGGVGEFVEGWLCLSLIDIAQGDDLDIVFLGSLLQIFSALAAHADAGDADDLAGRDLAEAEDVAGDDGDSREGRRGSAEHFSPRDGPAHQNTSVRTVPSELLIG